MKKAPRGVLRLLDANLNRCREGLRVLEDTFRFVREDENFFRSLRKLRHEVSAIGSAMVPDLLAARDSVNDQGRTIAEGKRASLDSIVRANFRRCSESLRTLEEYGKLFPGDADQKLKQARFQIYELERRAAALDIQVKK